MMQTTMLPGSIEPGSTPGPDPQDLMDRFNRRDPLAARELYRRFAPRIYGMGKEMLGSQAEAEQLVQDTFVHLWRTATGFDPARYSLDEWVFLTAFRAARGAGA